MKKSLTAVIGMLFCITANSQQINAIVTRQGSSSNKSHYQLSETPKFVLDGDNINVMVGETQKEQFGISTDALNIIFGSVINDNVNENDLTVKHPVIIENNGILTVTGTMINTRAEDLVIEDGGQLITGSSVHATMKKKITGNASNVSKASNVNWYTISSPLAANTAFANVTNLIPTEVTEINYDLYRLDEKNAEWINSRIYDTDGNTIIVNDNFKSIDKGLGYIYHNDANTKLEFKGEINVENVECALTNSAAHGFNLIGNPFTQNIKLANVKGVTLADGFYILTNENTWGANIESGTIAPLQGFLVQATEAGDVTISRPASGSKGERSEEQDTNIEIVVSNDNYKDNAYAILGGGAGLNKISHRNAEAPMLYIPQDNEDFAIAYMDKNTTLFPVNFKAMTTGNYRISLNATDDIRSLVLIDNMTGEKTNMLLEESYSFIGSPADRENRFMVRLEVRDSDDEDEQFVYQYGNELIIDGEGTLQMFDVLGRVVISEEVHGQRVDVSNLTTGAYIVRLTGENVMTQKIVVR
ncbi:MAG: T9SS type A sorting domain-containing protein [Bacteroidales bacterium]|nr:T9SS type A sorting domain-containing protein [Bacteroidales bacterium]